MKEWDGGIQRYPPYMCLNLWSTSKNKTKKQKIEEHIPVNYSCHWKEILGGINWNFILILLIYKLPCYLNVTASAVIFKYLKPI